MRYFRWFLFRYDTWLAFSQRDRAGAFIQWDYGFNQYLFIVVALFENGRREVRFRRVFDRRYNRLLVYVQLPPLYVHSFISLNLNIFYFLDLFLTPCRYLSIEMVAPHVTWYLDRQIRVNKMQQQQLLRGWFGTEHPILNRHLFETTYSGIELDHRHDEAIPFHRRCFCIHRCRHLTGIPERASKYA